MSDSNQRPTHYECVALPTELKWHFFRAQKYKIFKYVQQKFENKVNQLTEQLTN